MGTRSYIAMKTDENYVDCIYCHLDGYVEGVGYTLLQYYNDFKSVKKLMEYGDIMALNKNLKQCKKLYNNQSCKIPFEQFLEFTQSDDLSDIEYFYLYTRKGWYYCKARKGNILMQELRFNYNKEKLLQDAKQHALKKIENNEMLCLDTNLAKFLNYDWELAFINQDQAYKLFEKEIINLKLSNKEINDTLILLDIKVEKNLSDEYLSKVIAQEIFKCYLENERSVNLVGIFDNAIDNLIRKYFFSYTENLNFGEEITLDEFIKEKQIDLLKAYFSE
ncbi:hypothetical protein JG677_03060 [Campylobacter sp. TTU-622]|uniref:hypothetical protein n=1 Tax=Campylobacter sp. TTU-622 TaxID=2800583 RepID=UPI00190326B0|nr:hypothetical protein [Campylobacter sp. TTU-622]MBK1973032.1 hypothetical protein [Campylobacter sp. TTU-622]